MWKLIKAFFTTIIITFMGMFGGQKEKSARRFGIPLFAFFASLSSNFTFRDFGLLLLIPFLCSGYGLNSILMEWFNVDWLVRVMFAIGLSLPFLFYGIKRWLISLVALVLAFQVRAESLGTIAGFDFLIEDIVRYTTLGILISYNIYFSKEDK